MAFPPQLLNDPSLALSWTADYNAAGVTALAAGQEDVALLNFHKAFQVFAVGHESRRQEAAEEAPTPEQLPSQLPRGIAIPGMESGNLHCWNEALVFDHDGAVYDMQGISRYCCMGAILLFNKSLCLHHKGLRLGDRELLQEASQCYESCANTLTLIPPIQYLARSIMIFLFAVCNNQSVVSFHLQDNSAALRYFQKVQKVAVAVLMNDSEFWARVGNDNLKSKVFSTFLGNLFHIACIDNSQEGQPIVPP